ncbi:methyltransferase domain-containing protein [Myxococcaceae bacterium GXIMD 01537]
MSSTSPEAELAALIELHSGLERQGPGDAAFTRRMLSLLPGLPARPRIADLGCGSGASTLILAEHFQAPVTAVDLSRDFLQQLEARAQERGLAHLVRAVEGDMGALGWPEGSFDLLWSEGAAYHLTFGGAARRWRPLLASGGFAVISELSWFTDAPPAPAREFWDAAYPALASEAVNTARAREVGFEVLGVHRLPTEAWWANYYTPLLRRVEALRSTASPAMREVIRATDTEVDLFRRFSDAYGYAFYVLKAV